MDMGLNQTVARFEYVGRQYEIDQLIDTEVRGGFVYDLFDVTDENDAVSLSHFVMSHGVTVAELIAEAKEGIDTLEW